jgi:predicted RecB family nuclease
VTPVDACAGAMHGGLTIEHNDRPREVGPLIASPGPRILCWMREEHGDLTFSPTDVANHLGCGHRTRLELRRARGELERPVFHDPFVEVLQQKGIEHEAAYVDELRARGLRVVDLTEERSVEATLGAMTEGADAIVQARLADARWSGFADVLLRVGSAAGPKGLWLYEPVDTKLTETTKGGTLLQLGVYAQLLERMQGQAPERVWVKTPRQMQKYRVADLDAYLRGVQRRLEEAVEGQAEPYPHPVALCEVCDWWTVCDARRRADDHLSFVARLSRTHHKELERQGITTLERFARAKREPFGGLSERPERGAVATYKVLHEQAGLQLATREAGDGAPPRHAFVEAVEAGKGFERLPEPSPGDVFLDFEGDRFAEFGESGRGFEYLTGWCWRDETDGGRLRYEGCWARTLAEERAAFVRFVEFVEQRMQSFPDLHVFHFGIYEDVALKRLAMRHAVCEAELDRWLRGGRLVDLHRVTVESMRIGTERYGLKELEALSGYGRAMDLRLARRARQSVEVALQTGRIDDFGDVERRQVEDYNREDCESTVALRDWLEERRRAFEQERGVSLARLPMGAAEEGSENVQEIERKLAELMTRLFAGVPEDASERSESQRARWLLAHLLGYFRREGKATLWEYFRLRECDFEELLGERVAVSGLEFVEALPKQGREKLPRQRYRFPDQDLTIDEGSSLHPTASDCEELSWKPWASVVAIDHAEGTVDLKMSAEANGRRPRALFEWQSFRTEAMQDKLFDFARDVCERGDEAGGAWQAARDLWLRKRPRLKRPIEGDLRRDDETAGDALLRLAQDLDGGVLAIQGPPGTGKTTCGGRAILALAKAGYRVGVTAVSHKVVVNLLEKVIALRDAEGGSVWVTQKTTDGKPTAAGAVHYTLSGDARDAIAPGVVQGGTPFHWVHCVEPEDPPLDYLFVDEAGQMALAQTLAISGCAKNIVLLGDPQQLTQPARAGHPEGSDVAALVHVLGTDDDGTPLQTIARDRGLLLDRTWRLPPAIAEFTSRSYYDGRLESVDETQRQRLVAGGSSFAAQFDGAGLWLAEVEHEGNRSVSREEVQAIAQIARELLGGGRRFIDRDGNERPLRPEDILVVAPYNAQVAELERGLASLGIEEIGTVDRFQGREAPVVIYSCASSSAEDAPRGMEFLYDPHRFNVATSRAQCAVIVVASPRLFEPDCRTPEQIRMANGLCRYREMARRVRLDG